jgi:hypothetical protein
VPSARASTYEACSDERGGSLVADGRRGTLGEGVVAVSLAPVPSEQERASCPSCSAALAPDQRYCLACGQPVSPVRLSFLDVLQSGPEPYAGGHGALAPLPAGYMQVIDPSSGAPGWMRRYTGLFGLLSVLLMSIIVGLLVGHWITQSRAPGQQVIKVEGLSGGTPLAAAPSAAATSTVPTSTIPSPAAASKTEAKAEVKEVAEAKAIEKAKPPPPVKVNAKKLQKLGNTTGKKHEEEVNKLGAQPIETG